MQGIKTMINKSIFLSIIVLLILGTVLTVVLKLAERPGISSTKYDTFAQCLASTKLTMYGAAWCSHCQAEKLNFGDSFKYVPYVECTENPEACINKDIKGYPTWIDQAGKKYEGEQGLERLSQISGCPLGLSESENNQPVN